MPRWKNSLFNIAIALNCLLLFLLVFETRLVVPAWLQVVGRMHPLLLHFPIALVVFYALAGVFLARNRKENTGALVQVADGFLLIAALTSVLTALMGLFLSREPGYDAATLQWHKWSGVFVSLFTLAWYYFRNRLRSSGILSISSSLLAICLITLAGHQGAGITHGQNFLLAPMLPEKKEKLVAPEDAIVFENMVKPILESKCISCHNNSKAKGQLVMETEDLLLKGGKTGLLWDTTAADLGLLLRRVHLPLEQKKHMPPQGKVQLTEQEIAILTQWIKKGSSFKLKVIDLPPDDSLHQIAQAMFTAAETASYDFDEADQSDITKLNSVNRVVTEESLGSPALTVSFFNSQLFDASQLKELSSVKKQIVSLDLAKMPVKDGDLQLIAGFENLRKLNLSFTGIGGAALSSLSKLKFLRSLSLSGTRITATELKQLKGFPALKTVYTWNTLMKEDELAALKKEIPTIQFQSGFRGDTIVLQLSQPILQNDEVIITGPVPLKLKHYINGTSIRFTMDGTEPDSVNSRLFKGTEMIDGNALVKAKAYKPGWISSDILEANFYKNTYTADTLIFLTQPDPSYKGTNKLLIDLQKGETNFRNGSWMAWRQNRMEILLSYPHTIAVKNVTLSTLQDIGGYIMPPLFIEIWGGDDPAKLKLLGKITPQQPDKMGPNALRGYECKFAEATVRYLKVVAQPVSKLPGWHPGKGDKGWLFVDEVLVN